MNTAAMIHTRTKKANASSSGGIGEHKQIQKDNNNLRAILAMARRMSSLAIDVDVDSSLCSQVLTRPPRRHIHPQ